MKANAKNITIAVLVVVGIMLVAFITVNLLPKSVL